MRLLSYNMHKGIGGRDRRYRLQRIIDVIETENPDLICLQEVDRHVLRSKLDDQPQIAGRVFQLGRRTCFSRTSICAPGLMAICCSRAGSCTASIRFRCG